MEQLKKGWLKILNHLKIHKAFYIYLFFAAIFLVLLNTWIWPVPDSYFYATLAKVFKAGFAGDIALNTINTEHVSLIPFLVFLVNTLTGNDSFFVSRLVIASFSLGIITILYLTAKEIGIHKNKRIWWLLLLLLVPGFWVTSVYLMLDIPATFSIALLIYLLIKKAPTYQISLAVLFVLLVKEYYIYLIGPIVTVVILIDIIKDNKPSIIKKILLFTKQFCIIFLPSLIAIIILVFFNWLPYPRLLENSLHLIFGDLYILFTKTLVSFGKEAINQLSPVVEQTDTIVSADIIEKTKHLKLTGDIGKSLVSSTPPATESSSLIEKIWMIMKGNFGEKDINPIILALATLGLLISSYLTIKNFKHAYTKIRPHIIYILLFLMFTFFNFNQSEWSHGFRITLPVLFSLLFFSYIALKQLTKKPTKYCLFAFGLFVILAYTFYYISLQDYVYESVLANTSVLSAILPYKIYIFIFIYTILAIIIMLLHKIKWSIKYVLVALMIIGIFSIKFLPYYLDYKARAQTFEFDYGAEHATPTLMEIRAANGKIYSNFNPYKTQYYTNDVEIKNNSTAQFVRTWDKIYFNHYFNGTIDEALLNRLVTKNINYVYIENSDFNETDIKVMQEIINQYPEAFTEYDSYTSKGRLHWIIYKFNYTKL